MKAHVEVIGPWLHNSGDALMLWAVAAHYRARAKLGASSNLGLDHFPSDPSLYKVVWPARATEVVAAARRLDGWEIGRLARNSLMLALRADTPLLESGRLPGRGLDLVLDCSGYGYGDIWSLRRVGFRRDYYARLKRQGAAIAMLPQAFGPFEDPRMAEAMRGLLEQCDLVVARDSVSRSHLESLVPERAGSFLQAPDITYLLDGEAPADAEIWANRVAIVPNTRMLDRTIQSVRDSYLQFLVRAVSAVRHVGLEPVILVHETNDAPLVDRLSQEVGPPCPVLRNDALQLKGMIGAARGVIASRYHACVSALSQGVPTIGSSWNHKYEMLFSEHGCEDLLLSPDAKDLALETAVARWFADPVERQSLAVRIGQAAARQKAAVMAMWCEIDELAAMQAGRCEPASGHGTIPRAA